MTDIPAVFADIAPVDDKHFRDNMAKMVREPGLQHAVKYVMPDIDYPAFVKTLLSLDNKADFQREIMWPFMELVAKKTTDGVSASGMENLKDGEAYLFITNHRDIVLDASFLNICFFRQGRPATEVAIGSNLLIMPWIDTLVRINGCFIVKRDLKRLDALDAAKQLSAYIHHTIHSAGRSIWIAQREGRAKDSSDSTQESLIKMLALAGGDSTAANLAQIHIVPVAIAYEYDPNDYLKVKEFLQKRRNPEFKKSKRDDLFSMETGLLQFKGRVHFSIGTCLSRELDKMNADTPRNEVLEFTCREIDRQIHSHYKLYPINYIAYDELTDSDEYRMLYTDAEKERFMAYIDHQLSKVDLPGITPEERAYMRTMMFTMYANPLKNKRRALYVDTCETAAAEEEA